MAAARHAASSPSAFTAADLAEAMKRRLAPSGPQLSPREGQVLRLLADGMSVAGIAKQLFVSESTAKTHISKLYEKLGAANRAQALMTALRLGPARSPRRSEVLAPTLPPARPSPAVPAAFLPAARRAPTRDRRRPPTRGQAQRAPRFRPARVDRRAGATLAAAEEAGSQPGCATTDRRVDTAEAGPVNPMPPVRT